MASLVRLPQRTSGTPNVERALIQPQGRLRLTQPPSIATAIVLVPPREFVFSFALDCCVREVKFPFFHFACFPFVLASAIKSKVFFVTFLYVSNGLCHLSRSTAETTSFGSWEERSGINAAGAVP